MPIYEYECSACGHRLEAIQKLADAPLTVCPSCSQSKLSKLISAVGFRLSGSGWYETDFKSGNKRNLTENESSKPKEKKEDKKAAASPSTTASSSNSAGAKSSSVSSA